MVTVTNKIWIAVQQWPRIDPPSGVNSATEYSPILTAGHQGLPFSDEGKAALALERSKNERNTPPDQNLYGNLPVAASVP